MAGVKTRFSEGNEPGAYEGMGGWDHLYYRKQVQGGGVFWGGAFDDTFAFRYAAAKAKDMARNALIRAVRTEARRLQEESNTTLGLDYLNRDHDIAAFNGQAAGNARVQRSVDGVPDAPDDAIKL
jgi:hypothetical protein